MPRLLKMMGKSFLKKRAANTDILKMFTGQVPSSLSVLKSSGMTATEYQIL
jgi:hypothetical protein